MYIGLTMMKPLLVWKSGNTGIGAECISQLSAIDLFYLYGEISTRFNVFLTVEDIEGDCFSSLHNLVLTIHRACNQGGKNSEETC